MARVREQERRREEEERQLMASDKGPVVDDATVEQWMEEGWDKYDNMDCFPGQNCWLLPATDIEECKREGLKRRFGAFVVWLGKAYFRAQSPRECRKALRMTYGPKLYISRAKVREDAELPDKRIMHRDGWEELESADAFAAENAWHMDARDLERCKRVCRDKRWGGFVIWLGRAYFRRRLPSELREHTQQHYGSTLWIAPDNVCEGGPMAPPETLSSDDPPPPPQREPARMRLARLREQERLREAERRETEREERLQREKEERWRQRRERKEKARLEQSQEEDESDATAPAEPGRALAETPTLSGSDRAGAGEGPPSSRFALDGAAREPRRDGDADRRMGDDGEGRRQQRRGYDDEDEGLARRRREEYEEDRPRRRHRDEEELEEDRPSRRSRRAHDDEADRPRRRREEEECDAPRGDRRRRSDDDDDDDDDRGRRRRRDDDEEEMDDDRRRRPVRWRERDDGEDDAPRRRRRRDDDDDEGEDEDAPCRRGRRDSDEEQPPHRRGRDDSPESEIRRRSDLFDGETDVRGRPPAHIEECEDVPVGATLLISVPAPLLPILRESAEQGARMIKQKYGVHVEVPTSEDARRGRAVRLSAATSDALRRAKDHIDRYLGCETKEVRPPRDGDVTDAVRPLQGRWRGRECGRLEVRGDDVVFLPGGEKAELKLRNGEVELLGCRVRSIAADRIVWDDEDEWTRVNDS